MMNRKSCYANIEKWSATCRAQNKRYYNRTSFRHPRRNWTAEEDEIVLKHDMTDHEISKCLKRSVKSIQVRRSRLKKLEQLQKC